MRTRTKGWYRCFLCFAVCAALILPAYAGCEEEQTAGVGVSERVSLVRADPDSNAEYAAPGDTVCFELELRNDGDVDVQSVRIRDTLFSRINAGSLRQDGKKIRLTDGMVKVDHFTAGLVTVFTYETVVTEEDILKGEVASVPTVTAHPCGAPKEDSVTAECTAGIATEPPAAGIRLTLRTNVAEDQSVIPGTEILYTAELTNTGNVTCRDISLTVAGARFRQGNGYRVKDNTASAEKLPAGGTIVIRAAYTAAAGDLESGYTECAVSASADPPAAPEGETGKEPLSAEAKTRTRVTPETHKVTVIYRYDDGTEARPAFEGMFERDTEYAVQSPEIFGASPSEEIVSGVMRRKDVKAIVTYKSKIVTLTVRFTDEDGRPVAKEYTDRMRPGNPYRIIAPAVSHLTPDSAVVEGDMPDDDLTVTVIYRRE